MQHCFCNMFPRHTDAVNSAVTYVPIRVFLLYRSVYEESYNFLKIVQGRSRITPEHMVTRKCYILVETSTFFWLPLVLALYSICFFTHFLWFRYLMIWITWNVGYALNTSSATTGSWNSKLVMFRLVPQPSARPSAFPVNVPLQREVLDPCMGIGLPPRVWNPDPI